MDIETAEKILVKPPRKRPLADEIAALQQQQTEMLNLLVGLCSEFGKVRRQMLAPKRRGVWAWFQGWCS
jgi:hypothetical protein